MANRNAYSIYSSPAFAQTVFIDTNLGTHLATPLNHGDTVSSFKKKLLVEHQVCFPDVGDIEITALKVKRRGHFYHLSDTMVVTKVFDGISKSWFLFLEARKVVKEGENRQLQCTDSGMQVKYLTKEVEPLLDGPSRRLPDFDESSRQLVSDHQLVISRPSLDLSGADKQQPTDFDMEAEHIAGNNPDAHHPDTHAVENVVVDLQKVSAADDHNQPDPKLLEKERDIATSSEFVDGSTRNEVKDVQQNPNVEEAANTEAARSRKKTRKPKRKTRSSDDHAAEGPHGPSGASALTSAKSAGENVETKADKVSSNVDDSGRTVFEHRESAAPIAIEPSLIVRENAGVQDNSIETGGDVSLHKNNGNLVENAKPVEETSNLQTPARKRRKIERKTRKEDSVAGSVESMFNTNKAFTKPDALSPQPSLEDRPKISNLDAAEMANDHLEAISGLTASPTADKKKKRKKSSKDPNISAIAATYSRDLVNGNHVVPGEVDRADLGSEYCAITPGEKLDDPLTAAIGKETEMGESNVDNAVRSREHIPSAADNLQTADFASTPIPLVQKFKKPELSGNYTDWNIGHKDKNETLVHEVANLGTLSTKDDCEATANRDNSELNVDEAKGAKSSKSKRKSRKTKTPVEDTPVISGAQNVEGSGIDVSSTEPVKAVDGNGPDSVIRDVLEYLQQSKENEENLEKVEKKSRKKTKKKQPSNVIDGQGLSIEGNNAAEEEAPRVSIDELKEMVDSSKPLKKTRLGETSAFRQSSQTILEFQNDTVIESGDLSRKNTEVIDTPQDTMLHKLAGNDEGNPSNHTELFHEKGKADIGDSFGSTRSEHDIVASGKKLNQVANGTRAAEPGGKSNKKKKIPDLHPEGSIDGSRSSMKPNEKQGSSRRALPASSSTSQQPTKVKNGTVSLQNKDLQGLGTGANDIASHKLEKISKALIRDTTNASTAQPISKKMKEARVASVSGSILPNMADRHGLSVDQSHSSVKGTANKKEVVKGSSAYVNKNNPKDREKNMFPTSGKIFKDAENSNSEEDEYKISGASTRTPSDASSDYSDEDSDGTFMSQKPGLRVFDGEGGGETKVSSGRKDMSLEKILRSSSRFKKAKLTASQSQPDSQDDESLPFDCVPDSQAN